ncbi:MAG: SIR2 family protein [Magnetococcus sp. WYHC-3]
MVPFLGAGISYRAAHDQENWESTPERMTEQLRERLCSLFFRELDDDSSAGATLAKLIETNSGLGKWKWDDDSSAGATLAKLIETNSGLGKWAEMMFLLEGPVQLCQTLAMDQYAHLQPLRTHRYLVCLAREGVIGEIITTNYDCCIETAWRESFDQPTENRIGVVTNLDQYRDLSGKHNQPGDLLIYKINGCAGAYEMALSGCSEPEKLRAAERIILTERQLQNFRNERWAQDLFCDRSRSRNIFFAGFGSEEPQIRHTANTLMEEFARANGTVKVKKCDEAMDLSNAPFMLTHEPWLSFSQLQIMTAFLDAHCVPVYSMDHPEYRIEPLFRNICCPLPEVTPAHKPMNPSPDCPSFPPKDKLDASDFFHCLFTHVFRLLLQRSIDQGGAVHSWFRTQVSAYRLWLHEISRLINGDEKAVGAGTQQKLGKLQELLSQAEANTTHLPALWRELWRARHPAGQEMPRGWYLPLREEPLFIPLTILMLHLLRTQGASAQTTPEVLRQPETFQLLHEDALQSRFTDPEAQEKGCRDRHVSSRLRRFIVIPSHSTTPSSGRWQTTKDGHPTVIRIGQWVAVDAGDIVRRAVNPQQFHDALNDCFTAPPARQNARLRQHQPKEESP